MPFDVLWNFLLGRNNRQNLWCHKVESTSELLLTFQKMTEKRSRKNPPWNLTVSLSKCKVKTFSVFPTRWRAFEENLINLGSFSNNYPGYYSKIGLSCDVCQHYLLQSIDGSSLCLFKWQGWDFIFQLYMQASIQKKGVRLYQSSPCACIGFSLLQGTAKAINRDAVKVRAQGDWERGGERGRGELEGNKEQGTERRKKTRERDRRNIEFSLKHIMSEMEGWL